MGITRRAFAVVLSVAAIGQYGVLRYACAFEGNGNSSKCVRSGSGHTALAVMEDECCPSVGACGDCDCTSPPGLIFYADYLYWNVRHQGLDFATIQRPSGDPLVAPTDIGNDSLTFDRHAGIRAGVGYHFATNWDLTWTCTSFFTRGNAAVADGGLASQLTAPESFLHDELMDTIRADGSLRIDMHDLEASRVYDFDAIAFRVFGGIRWVSIEEQFDTFYHREAIAGPTGDGTINMPTTINGGGVRFGGELQWNSRRGVRLFGRGGLSLLIADVEMRKREFTVQDGPITDFAQRSTNVVPVIETAVGLAWYRGPLEISAGYEMQMFGGVTPASGSDIQGGRATGQLENVFQSIYADGLFVRVAYVH